MRRLMKHIGLGLALILVFQIGYRGAFAIGSGFAIKPDTVVYNIGADNNGTVELFNNSAGRFWYPGFKETSEMTLYNTRNHAVKVNNFGMEIVSLTRDGSDVPVDVKADYMDKMLIRLYRGIGQDTFFEGTFKTFDEKGTSGSFGIVSGGSEDIGYTIGMATDAPQTISNIQARINFIFTAGGNPPTDRPDPPPPDPEFEIVPMEDPALGILEKIFIGYEDKTMDIYRTMNRAELACVIYRALQLEPVEPNTIFFTDQTVWWYETEAKTVVDKGYMQVDAESRFNGQDMITKRELGQVLAAAFKESVKSNDTNMGFIEYSQIYLEVVEGIENVPRERARVLMRELPDMPKDFKAEYVYEPAALGTPGEKPKLEEPVTRLRVARLLYKLMYGLEGQEAEKATEAIKNSGD